MIRRQFKLKSYWEQIAFFLTQKSQSAFGLDLSLSIFSILNLVCMRIGNFGFIESLAHVYQDKKKHGLLLEEYLLFLVELNILSVEEIYNVSASYY